MRKWILFLMIFIAPMHLAWAGNACYGHIDLSHPQTHLSAGLDDHSHQHEHNFIEFELVNVDGDDHSAHCDACHAHAIAVIQNDLSWPAVTEQSIYHTSLSSISTLNSSDPPYRPKWPTLI